MHEETLSGGSARLGQSMLLLFFIPFNLFLFYIIISKNFSAEGISFAAIIAIASFLIIRNAFSYADIYLKESLIVIKKLFSVKKIPVTGYRKIEKALLPFTYYFEFDDNKKVFFFLKVPDVFRETISLDPDIILKELRLKFKQLKENEEVPAANKN